MNNTWDQLKSELVVLKERVVHGDSIDPVLEGEISEFLKFDTFLRDTLNAVTKLTGSLVTFNESMDEVGACFVHHLSKTPRDQDQFIGPDSVKYREGITQITRPEAPHSACAKFRRDLEYNIIVPIKYHIVNNRKIKNYIDLHRRKLAEVNAWKKKQTTGGNTSYGIDTNALLNFKKAQEEFDKVDVELFEWLSVLKEFRYDIIDATVQTMKYLQYEYFASGAHSIANILPAQMEFRPMVEMTPDHMERVVKFEMENNTTPVENTSTSQEEESALRITNMEHGGSPVSNFSSRFLKRFDNSINNKEESTSDVIVDVLSLSSLISQGFDESKARRALRVTNNNTQKAMEWLLSDGKINLEGNRDAIIDSVRYPTTIKRIQQIKEYNKGKIISTNETEEETDSVTTDDKTERIIQNDVELIDFLSAPVNNELNEQLKTNVDEMFQQCMDEEKCTDYNSTDLI